MSGFVRIYSDSGRLLYEAKLRKYETYASPSGRGGERIKIEAYDVFAVPASPTLVPISGGLTAIQLPMPHLSPKVPRATLPVDDCIYPCASNNPANVTSGQHLFVANDIVDDINGILGSGTAHSCTKCQLTFTLDDIKGIAASPRNFAACSGSVKAAGIFGIHPLYRFLPAPAPQATTPVQQHVGYPWAPPPTPPAQPAGVVNAGPRSSNLAAQIASQFSGGQQNFAPDPDFAAKIKAQFENSINVRIPVWVSVCECGAHKAMGAKKGDISHSTWCPWSKP